MNKEELRHIYDVSLFNINDLDVLLHEILKSTRELLNAEGGSIYINTKDYLKFHVFQNDAFSYEEIYRFYHSFKDYKFPLSQYDRYLAVDSFLTKKIILVDDIYNNEQYDLLGIKEFDARFKYKTHNIITAPLIHPIENKVLGVVQLINKKVDDKIEKFNSKDKELLSILSSFISLSISKAQSDVKKLQELNDKLKDANETLESKIEEEIENSKNKSAIIFQQSKLSSMGEVMGNIANQWREPLNTISTMASATSLDIQLDNLQKDKAINDLNKIVDTAKELSVMVDDFKSFYEVDSIKENFYISEIVNKNIEISDNILNANKIKIVKNLGSDPKVYNLKSEFIQALFNLIENSIDALVKNISINDNRLIFIDVHSDENEDKVIVKVTDNAGGINENIANSIFEQSIDYKSLSSKKGIGLFVSRLIIESHMKGSLDFQNITYNYKENSYKGTQFTITI